MTRETKQQITRKRTAAPKVSKAAKPATQPTHDDIARRAYELYEARGHQDGHHFEDWLTAERELAG